MKEFHLQTYQAGDLPLSVELRQERPLVQRAHRHDCFEIMFVTAGSGVCRINERVFPLLRGDFYLMGLEDVHSYRTGGCFYYNILFSSALFTAEERRSLAEIPLFHDWFGAPRRVRAAGTLPEHDCAMAAELLRRVETELKRRNPGWHLAAKSMFGEFLLLLLRHAAAAAPKRPGKDEATETFSKVNHYILAHLGEKLDRRTLARVAAVSPGYFSELFRQWTGTTTADYLRHQRIARARRLLEEGKLSMAEIAGELGFCDSCHFSRVFRAVTMMTPREYRASCALAGASKP